MKRGWAPAAELSLFISGGNCGCFLIPLFRSGFNNGGTRYLFVSWEPFLLRPTAVDKTDGNNERERRPMP